MFNRLVGTIERRNWNWRAPTIRERYATVLMLVKFWRHEFSAENDEIARSVVFFLSLFSLIYLGDRVRERICSWTEKRGQVREGP